MLHPEQQWSIAQLTKVRKKYLRADRSARMIIIDEPVNVGEFESSAYLKEASQFNDSLLEIFKDPRWIKACRW
jgi:hypothetical protein